MLMNTESTHDRQLFRVHIAIKCCLNAILANLRTFIFKIFWRSMPPHPLGGPKAFFLGSDCGLGKYLTLSTDWTRNPLTGCPKGQVMRGILKGLALNNPHNRKLQDYAKLTRSEQGQRANRKYRCYLDSQNMHHLAKKIVVKSVIDPYENMGPKDNRQSHPSSPPGTRMSPQSRKPPKPGLPSQTPKPIQQCNNKV